MDASAFHECFLFPGRARNKGWPLTWRDVHWHYVTTIMIYYFIYSCLFGEGSTTRVSSYFMCLCRKIHKQTHLYTSTHLNDTSSDDGASAVLAPAGPFDLFVCPLSFLACLHSIPLIARHGPFCSISSILQLRSKLG